MTDSTKLQWIHDTAHRQWNRLDLATRRRVIELLPDELNEQTILKAIRKAKRERVTANDLTFTPSRHGAQYR